MEQQCTSRMYDLERNVVLDCAQEVMLLFDRPSEECSKVGIAYM
jgi:hypothetical protein